jgi:hypothetical protein
MNNIIASLSMIKLFYNYFFFRICPGRLMLGIGTAEVDYV